MTDDYFKSHTKSINSRISSLRTYSFIVFVFLMLTTFAQETTNLYAIDFQEAYNSYSLSQLATHNFHKEDVSKKVDWTTFYPNYKGGMEKLQLDIKKDPSEFPLQELEDKSKFEPDAFRRWEYQMRRMSATIISPSSNLLDVRFKTKENITFCETSSFELVIDIKNSSGFDLPNFYFNIKELPGAVINSKKIKLPKGISFVEKANTFTFNQGFSKNASTTITLSYSVGCDGHGGSPVLKGKSKISSTLNWEINLIGYLLDYDNKELYKVIDFGNSPKTIKFNKQTK